MEIIHDARTESLKALKAWLDENIHPGEDEYLSQGDRESRLHESNRSLERYSEMSSTM